MTKKEKEYGYKMTTSAGTHTKWCRDEKERNTIVKALESNKSVLKIERIERPTK